MGICDLVKEIAKSCTLQQQHKIIHFRYMLIGTEHEVSEQESCLRTVVKM